MFQKIYKSCCLFESKPIRNIVLKINGAEKKSCSKLIITSLRSLINFSNQPAIKILHEQNFQSCFIFRGYVMSDNSKIEIYVALHSIDPPENSIV